MPLPETDETLVRQIIQKTPLIDNFGRPLFAAARDDGKDFLDAYPPSTLARSRATAQLARLLRCPATPDDVGASIKIRRRTPEARAEWGRLCLHGTRALIESPELFEPASTADMADVLLPDTQSRKVAVHAVEHILDSFFEDSKDEASPFDDFQWIMDRAIEDSIDDPERCAFEGIACFHHGDDDCMEPDMELVVEAYGQFMAHEAENGAKGGPQAWRLQHPEVQKYILHRLACLIRDSPNPAKKPIRLHAGCGHTPRHPLAKVASSPTDLDAYVATYPEVPFVIMGSGYPSVQAAAQLAATHPHVYVDVGIAFSLLSRDGQEKLLREMLEVCPWSKILGGTGGGRVPETFYLGQLQLREALERVLCDLGSLGDMTWEDAADAARAILYRNANSLYHLEFEELASRASCPTDEIALHTQADPPPLDQLKILEALVNKHGSPVNYAALSYVDLTGTQRQKSMHTTHLWSVLKRGKPLSMGLRAAAAAGFLQNDAPVPGFSPAGGCGLYPDFRWIKFSPDHQIVMHGELRDEKGVPIVEDPRAILERTLEAARKHGLEFRIGFGVELVVLQLDADGNYRSLAGSDGHAFATVRAHCYPKVMPLLHEAVNHLVENGVPVEQFHAESAPGQFEIVLGHTPPLEAVDNLVFARQVVAEYVSSTGDYLMTLHPKPFPMACGSALHVHMSISSPGGDDESVYEPFYAGLLDRLPAVSAFTLPSPASWERVLDRLCAGGTHVAWGTQNRETLLRKVKDSHWGFGALDGTANPFLAVAAIIAAGTLGVVKKEPLTMQDLRVDPATLSSKELARKGVKDRLPGSTASAVNALVGRKDLCQALGKEFIETYTAVKAAEMSAWERMSHPGESWKWVVDHY